MTDFEPSNKNQILLEYGVYLTLMFVATGVGFWIMGNQGTFTDSKILFYWLLYIVLNAVYVGFSGIFMFAQGLSGKLMVYLHNYDYSWFNLNGLFQIPKNNALYDIFKSFWLSLLFWHILFLPLTLIQFALPRQTAILFLPVKPQVVFPIVILASKIFFTIFPASTGETGILALFNSLISTGGFRLLKKNKAIAVWLLIIIVSAFSGFMWLTVHGFASQGEELSKQSHYVFGVEQGFLMVLTGSIAPAIALHNTNLLFYGIIDVVGKYELLRVAIPIVVLLVWIGMFALIAGINKSRRS